MILKTTFKTISILCFIICLSINTVVAKTMPSYPIMYSLETQDKLAINEMLEFTLGLTPKRIKCDEIEVTVETVGDLSYFGQDYWTVPYNDKIETNYLLDVIVPDNDTSALVITVSCGDYSNTIYRYFITTADSVEMIRGRPTIYPEGFVRPKFVGRIGNVIPGEFPEDDSLYGIPVNPTLLNYESSETHQWSKEEIQLKKMRMLEREPLTDKDKEGILIGTQPYTRYRGDYKFTKVKTYTEEELRGLHLKRKDSLLANPPNNVYNLTIDLRNNEDYTFVNELIDSLIPTDTIGFYRAIVTKTIVNKMTFKNINYKRTNRIRRVKLRDEKDRPAPKKKTD